MRRSLGRIRFLGMINRNAGWRHPSAWLVAQIHWYRLDVRPGHAIDLNRFRTLSQSNAGLTHHELADPIQRVAL